MLQELVLLIDTLVYTQKGYIPIQTIRAGDDIYSRDERTVETVVITGTKAPCNPGRSKKTSRGCQKAMQDFAQKNNINILYFVERNSVKNKFFTQRFVFHTKSPDFRNMEE